MLSKNEFLEKKYFPLVDQSVLLQICYVLALQVAIYES